MMTKQKKLEKIKDILRQYADNDKVFVQPAEETEQQKQFREDLHTVVSILFKEDLNLPADMSAAEIKARMRTIWEKTKPEEWK
jgi:hypothetical protein